MAVKEQERPRLIPILSVLLLIQAPLILFLGLNLLTNHWTFLISWSVFWEDVREAFALMLDTPGVTVINEVPLFDLVGFGILVFSALMLIVAGMTFRRGAAFSWVLSLIAQIGTLVTGIGLYFIHTPSQAYWLMGIGILMVIYLNYAHVRRWFLQSIEDPEGTVNG